MTSRKTRAGPVQAGPPETVNYLSELGRQQLAVATEASCAMLRGFEAMRRIQQRAAHQAVTRHEAAAHKLHGPLGSVDLMDIQSTLWQGDLQAATQYWQQLAATAMEMQTEIVGCASHLVDSDAALEGAAAIDALDMLPGLKSALYCWKT